jgi:hypothetical protein
MRVAWDWERESEWEWDWDWEVADVWHVDEEGGIAEMTEKWDLKRGGGESGFGGMVGWLAVVARLVWRGG